MFLYAVTSDYMPPKHLSHLQHARQMLVNKLAPKHDLRKRVRVDGNGELLPEQPSGRSRASFKWPPARKRGRALSDPTMVLARRVLMTMWNDKYHLKEEWDRAHAKMSENRKKLGMRERPYKKSNVHKKSKEGSPDTSSDKRSDRAAKAPAKKKRKRGADTQAAGDRISDERPAKKRRRLPEISALDNAAYQSQSAFERDGSAAKKSADFREKL